MTAIILLSCIATTFFGFGALSVAAKPALNDAERVPPRPLKLVRSQRCPRRAAGLNSASNRHSA